MRISPLRVSTTCSPASLRTTFEPGELDDAGLLGFVIAFFDGALTDAADVERTHRELRARLADALGGDDAHGHAFFDHASRSTDPCRSSRRQMPSGASQVIGLRTWILSRPSSSIRRAMLGVISSFSLTITSSVIGLTMLCRLTRPRIESARLTSTFSPR